MNALPNNGAAVSVGSGTLVRRPKISRMKTRTETGYGFFCGGDPRRFWPDGESCSAKEMENHAAACKLWNEAEARGETPTPEACPSGWVYDADGKPLFHVLRAPYGIGTYEYDVEDDEPESSPNNDVRPSC